MISKIEVSLRVRLVEALLIHGDIKHNFDNHDGEDPVWAAVEVLSREYTIELFILRLLLF